MITENNEPGEDSCVTLCKQNVVTKAQSQATKRVAGENLQDR
jgi:hypothetical protein